MKRLLPVIGLLVLMGILAAGCAPPAPAVAMLQATETPTAAVEDMAADETAPESQPLQLPSTLPEPDNNCIDCHSDAEQLQLLAEEEEVVEAPSEGSG